MESVIPYKENDNPNQDYDVSKMIKVFGQANEVVNFSLLNNVKRI